MCLSRQCKRWAGLLRSRCNARFKAQDRIHWFRIHKLQIIRNSIKKKRCNPITVLYLFFNGFIRLFYYYYTIIYGTTTLLASILEAWKAWISDIPSWVSRWTSCAQLMDSKLPTTCTQPWPHLTHNSISVSLTHPYHTTATLTKTFLSYILLRNIVNF